MTAFRLPKDAPLRRCHLSPEQMLAVRRHRSKTLQELKPITINAALEIVAIRLLDEHGIHRDQLDEGELQRFVTFCFHVLGAELEIEWPLRTFAELVQARAKVADLKRSNGNVS